MLNYLPENRWHWNCRLGYHFQSQYFDCDIMTMIKAIFLTGTLGRFISTIRNEKCSLWLIIKIITLHCKLQINVKYSLLVLSLIFLHLWLWLFIFWNIFTAIFWLFIIHFLQPKLVKKLILGRQDDHNELITPVLHTITGENSIVCYRDDTLA